LGKKADLRGALSEYLPYDFCSVRPATFGFQFSSGRKARTRASGRCGPVAIAAAKSKSANAKLRFRPRSPIARQISPRGEIINLPYSIVKRPPGSLS